MNKIGSKSPLVSILMPARNVGETIGEAIDSILNQTMEDFEFIIVNDNSTDDTERLIIESQKNDPRIIFVQNEGDGIVDALNAGIEHVQSPFIARMDADDITTKNRLQRQIEVFSERDDIILLGTYYYRFEGDFSNLSPITMPLDNERIKNSLRSFPTLGHPTIMVKTDAIHKIGGYRKRFDGAEDHDLYLRLIKVGKFAVLPEFHYFYRAHHSQYSQAQKAKGYRASVACAYCDICIHENKTDPSSTDKTCEEIVFEMLVHLSKGFESMTRDKMKLCVRAVQSLTLIPELFNQTLDLRKKIIINLLKSKQYKMCYIFWKSTRRKKWLTQ